MDIYSKSSLFTNGLSPAFTELIDFAHELIVIIDKALVFLEIS